MFNKKNEHQKEIEITKAIHRRLLKATKGNPIVAGKIALTIALSLTSDNITRRRRPEISLEEALESTIKMLSEAIRENVEMVTNPKTLARGLSEGFIEEVKL